MSSGPAIAISDGGTISNASMIFGGAVVKNEVHAGENSLVEAKSNHLKTPGVLSKNIPPMKLGESGDISTNGPYHALCSARTESMDHIKKKSVSRKSPVFMKSKASMVIDASGDGLPRIDKIMSVTSNDTDSLTNHDAGNAVNDPRPQKTKHQSEQSYCNNSSIQTYAKAAGNTVAILKAADSKQSMVQGSNVNHAGALKTEDASVMNGGLEGDVASKSTKESKDDEEISQDKLVAEKKALKETVAHNISKPPDDNTTDRLSNDNQGSEQEILVVSNYERATEETLCPNDSPGSNNEADNQGLKQNSGLLRREVEKPPRMQKQRSQDRLVLKQQQKPSLDSETKRETLSRESSFECVDSTGVDVHEFLVNTLRNSTRDRAILLKIEHDMIEFVNDKTIDFMKFPPMTSYHRMLVHRVAAYFGMDHNVDETGKSVIINKTSSTRLPEIRFADQFDPRQIDQHSSRRDDDMRRRSILKRTNQSRSFDRDDMKGSGSWKDRQRSIEEREEAYEKVRARIFSNQEASLNSPPMYGRRGISSMAAARMASWTDRPWNSSEIDHSVRMQGPRPLTTRASSYSSILPRYNSTTSVKTGSSSSVSSMNGGGGLQNFAQGRQPMNMGPRPPTPSRRSGMGDNNNGTFYYMQHQNQGMPYLSPEGYQLVYQSNPGASGTGGIASPQFARYFRMPPQPHQPAVVYPQGYNPYEESQQKAQASNSSDYAMISPMSTYPHNMSSTTTVYSNVQGQPNISYTYQPTVYRPTSEPPSMAGNNLSQPGVQVIPQGKQIPQQPTQGFVPQLSSGTPVYPPYVMGQTPQMGGNESAPSHASAGAVNQRTMTHPIPVMQQVTHGYSRQAVYSPATHNPTANESCPQDSRNDPSKSSPSLRDAKKTEDELSEKMQAIVLKNLQPYQGQVSDSAVSEPTNTVTTSLSPSANTVQNMKHPDMNQSRNNAGTSRGHPSEGYQYHYTNANGMPQAQSMQVYLMPTNNPGNAASYRTYSQFINHPQTPHVMGPGMQFVYLSPPMNGMVGVDGHGIIGPANMQVYHPGHMQQPARQGSENSPAYFSNTNNNNAANTENASSYHTPNSKPANDVSLDHGMDDGNGDGHPHKISAAEAKHVSVRQEVDENEILGTVQDVAESEPSSGPGSDQVNETLTPQVSTSEVCTSVTQPSNTNNSNNQTYHGYGQQFFQQQQAPTSVFIGNSPNPYSGPISYPAGVIPQYSVYPNIGPSPYVYLPTTSRNSKMTEMKMYPTQAASSQSSGFIAVQLPNQNQLQFVPAGSLNHQNPIYYPQSYLPAADYTNPTQVALTSASPRQQFKPEDTWQPDIAHQTNGSNATPNDNVQQDDNAEFVTKGPTNGDCELPNPDDTRVDAATVENQ